MSFSDIFKGKEQTVELKPMKEDWQKNIQGQLSSLINQYVSSYQPGKEYSRLSQMMTPSTYEQQGLDYLQDYISGNIGTTGVMAQAEDVLSKTLAGEYDPYESKYYESLRRNIEKERQQSIKTLNQELSAAGLGGSSYRRGRLVDITSGTYDKISDVLAQLQETERINQLNAIQTAMNFSNTTEGQIQNKLSTIMGYGALPRELEGVGYEDFLRKQTEYAGIADLANSLYQYNVPYGMKEISYETPKDWQLGLSKMMSIADPGGSYMGNYGNYAQDMQGLGRAMELYSAWRSTAGNTGGGLNTQA